MWVVVRPDGLEVGFERNVCPGSRGQGMILASEQPHRSLVVLSELLERTVHVKKLNSPHHSPGFTPNSLQNERFQEIIPCFLSELPGQSWNLPFICTSLGPRRENLHSVQGVCAVVPPDGLHPTLRLLSRYQTCKYLQCARGRSQKQRQAHCTPPSAALSEPTCIKNSRCFRELVSWTLSRSPFLPQPEQVSPD